MALAYIDKEIEYADIHERVQALILAEMQVFRNTKKHYLAHLPSVPEPFVNNPLLQEVYSRVTTDSPLNALDESRYAISKPEDINDIIVNLNT
jgi:hypothetical protein